jgi:hypothetical protein
MLATFLKGAKGAGLDIRSSQITQTLSISSITATAPSGIVDGDLLIMHVAGHSSTTVSTPSGWTLIASNTTYATATFYKTASSEPFSYSISTGAVRDWTVAIVALVGGTLDQTNNLNTTAATISNTGVSVTNDKSLLLFIVTTTLSGVTFSTPTGMTGVDSADTNRPSAAVFYSFVDSGSTGTISTTPSSNQFSTSFLCSIF